MSSLHPSLRKRDVATSSGVSTPAVMYFVSISACFDRRSAASVGVGCHSGGHTMPHPSGSSPPVGPSCESRSSRTTRRTSGSACFFLSAATTSYQLRMSLSPVALSPAGACPMSTVTGIPETPASMLMSRSRMSATPLSDPTSTRS